MKTKRNAPARSYASAKNKSYGVGGAVMTLGKNLLQGKKLGSGAFKGVLRAGITPGSGIGAGIGLAGALAGKSKNPKMQNLGKALGLAGNVAGMFTGGGGGDALSGLAGKLAGGGIGQAAGKFAGNFGGMDKALHGLGAGVQGAGGALPFLAQNLFQAEGGMRVRRYDEGGKNRRKKKVELIEPMMDPSIFASDPYSASSMGRQVVDKMYNSGAGKARGLESRLTFNPSSEQYTRTQLESSPVSLEKGGKVYGEDGMKVVRRDDSDPKKPNFPQIDIERKNIQTNANPDVGGGDFKNEYQFMLDGAPATSQEAAAALKLSQEGVDNPQSFNDFVHSYLDQYHAEKTGGGGGKGMHSYRPQIKSKNTRKESAGSEGLLEALRQYGERT